MFKPATLRVFAIIAMVLSLLGLALSLLLVRQSGGGAVLAVVSWGLLLWASYLGFKLTSYKLYEDEYKKVGIRIYLIIAAFIAFLTIGMVAGLVVATALLATLWGMKRNYDEWTPTPSEELNNSTE